MLVPYAAENPHGLRRARKPLMTWGLIGIHVLLSAWVICSDHNGEYGTGVHILHTYGLIPARLHSYSLFTYLFFHQSAGHLLSNMVFLWLFGPSVEEAVGRARFLGLYITAGVLGGGFQALVTRFLLPEPVAGLPIVGASAACAGLVGLFAVRYYRAWLYFVGVRRRIHVVTAVLLYLLLEAGGGLVDLAERSTAGGVAHWAHVVGFAFGLACAWLLRLDQAAERAYHAADAREELKRSTPGAAVRRWEAAIARTPDSPAPHAELARSWFLLGDLEQAAIHYRRAVCLYLEQGGRKQAADLFVEMAEQGVRRPGIHREDLSHSEGTPQAGPAGLALTPTHLFLLANGLEQLPLYAHAADAYRLIVSLAPGAVETETAYIKLITLNTHQLTRFEEARIYARLFQQNFPRSQWRAMVQDLDHQAAEKQKGD